MANNSEGDIRPEENKNKSVPPEVALPDVLDLHERHRASMEWKHGHGHRHTSTVIAHTGDKSS